jgi:hypothetical protein
MRQDGALTELATIDAVRELSEGELVELWLTVDRVVVVRAFNECRNAYTDIDIYALLGALRGREDSKVASTVTTFRNPNSD